MRVGSCDDAPAARMGGKRRARRTRDCISCAPMKRAFVLLALAACNKPDTQTTTVASASASAKAPPAPFTGTLTGDRVMASKDLVRPLEPWSSAQAKLEGQMGKET